MADAGIKRVTIDQNNLPPVTITDNQMLYFLRYRITTEDKNRQSHWSPIYRVTAPPIKNKLTVEELTNLPNLINIDTSAAPVYRIDWTLPQSINNLTEFDVYYRYNYVANPQNTFIFGGTVGSNNFSAILQDVAELEVAIQIPTFPKIRFEDATIFIANTQA